MAGWLTDGVPQLTQTTGNETASFDTNSSGGANPLTGAQSIIRKSILVIRQF